jgi:O-antigen ligase
MPTSSEAGPTEKRLRIRDLALLPPRWVLVSYGLAALGLSAVLLAQARRRGVEELLLWSIAYVAIAAFSVSRPPKAPVVAGFAALLLGWVKTNERGVNLDLGLGLVALATGVYVLDRARRRPPSPLDLPGAALLSIALWSLVSLVFSVARIRAFTPAPGFEYHVYPFNLLGLSSEEAVVRATIGATAMFVWFGLYEFARRQQLHRERLNVAVFLVLLVNSGVLLWQRYGNPDFLYPHGFPLVGRLNGVTSFCYALGDVVVALFLLLPLWGSARGVRGVLTAGSLLMLLHAAIASGSRTALLTLIGVSLLWIGLRGLRFSRKRRRLAATASIGAAVLLLSAAAVAYRAASPNQSTPFGRFKREVARRGLYGSVFETRLQSYPLIFRILGQYPLSGVGAGLYTAEVSKQRGLLMPDLTLAEPYLLSSYAPNQFLNVGAELGVPAMLALALVFACTLVAAATTTWTRRAHARSGDLLISLLALGGSLLLGPSFYTSEALVFLFLLVGSAARGDVFASDRPSTRPRVFGTALTAALLTGTAVLGIGGQILSRPSLAIDRQWTSLRWRMAMGMKPPEPGGRWTEPEATLAVDTRAPEVTLRWHAGDETVRGYRADVSFYVDGVLVERSPAVSGRVRESTLPLPDVDGYKRISVRVWPPFVPAAAGEGDDRRRLGIFIHSVTPVDATDSAGSPPAPDPEE